MSAASYPYSQAHAHAVALLEETSALGLPRVLTLDLLNLISHLSSEAEVRRGLPSIPIFDDPLA